MKYLYFLRHGIAVLPGTPGYPNDDRPLTDEGHDKMQKEAKGIRRIIDDLDMILSSPLKRAHDTALIVAKAMGIEHKIETTKTLLPGCRTKEFLALLEKYADKEHILVVGHEPDLSAMISELAGSQRTIVEMKKGALCRVELDGIPPKGPGEITWLIQPKILREIRKK